MTIISNHGTFEYVEESSFAAAVSNPAMLWVGIVQKAGWRNINKNEDYRGMKAQSSTTKLQIAGNAKTGAEHLIDLEYQPQDWTFYKKTFNNASGGTMTDTIDSFNVGFISADSTPKYARAYGVKIDEATVEIAEDKLAKVTMKLMVAHVPLSTNDPWGTTYIGSGSHATASAGAVLGFNDITTLTLGGASFNATNLKWTVKNNSKVVKDPSSSNTANVVDIVPQKRDITFSCTVRRSAINDFAVKHFGYGANNIVVTISGSTFTFTGAKIPEELYNFGEEGVSEMDVTFTGITDLTIT